MNVMTLESLSQWNARFPLTPGSLPDDTFVTAEGLKQQTVHLGDDMIFGRAARPRRVIRRLGDEEILGGRIVGGRVVIREFDLKDRLRMGRGTTPAMGPG